MNHVVVKRLGRTGIISQTYDVINWKIEGSWLKLFKADETILIPSDSVRSVTITPYGND